MRCEWIEDGFHVEVGLVKLSQARHGADIATEDLLLVGHHIWDEGVAPVAILEKIQETLVPKSHPSPILHSENVSYIIIPLFRVSQPWQLPGVGTSNPRTLIHGHSGCGFLGFEVHTGHCQSWETGLLATKHFCSGLKTA